MCVLFERTLFYQPLLLDKYVEGFKMYMINAGVYNV